MSFQVLLFLFFIHERLFHISHIMPPKKRTCIGKVTKKSKEVQERRRDETNEEREKRILEMRNRASTSRLRETEVERSIRLEDKRKRAATSREEETEEARSIRLEDKRKRAATSREEETEEARSIRLEDKRKRAATSREEETEEARSIRLEDKRKRAATSREEETEQVHQQRIFDIREATRLRRSANHCSLLCEAFHYDPLKDYSQHHQVSIGLMEKICSFCHATRFVSESPGICCRNGKVMLPTLEALPNELRNYMTGNSSESQHFLKNIRRYNSCFQMTSFGATSIVQQPGFPTTFTVQGQVYHRTGSLLPMPQESPKFLQIYFIGDEQQEINQRCEHIPGVRRDIVVELQTMLHRENELIKTFQTALERMPTDDFKIVIKADKRPIGAHERQYNAPQVDEVAIVISGEDFEQRDIVLHRRNNSLQRIPETHRSYDALQYPLIFPRGEDGYHFSFRQINPDTGLTTNKKISAMDFYAFRLMIRGTETNHILNFRHLFHQYVVDVYAKIESERLQYVRFNQNKLRSEEYVHLRDAVASDGNVEDLGRLVILPSTFTGSPRHMHEYTQDALTYVRTYGRPDLFITFTCNPKWKEIHDLLQNGQAASDRHDLIARVFRQKQLKFINVITKEHIFGATRCWMYTIEYQKRGLPHSHNLIWLVNKIHPTQIDDIICAELPNETQDPALFAIVKKNMIHGPCGPLNPRSPCMKDGHCTKKYPRPFVKETQSAEDGYPLYRRRSPEDGGFKTTLPRGTEIDNTWIVPYSPLLSKMFEGHINVEYCNSVKSIKYVCKYVNKGSDMAVFGLSNENKNDEVMNFQLGRYISSSEAVWRILGFPIHERHPTVFHLSVHLENGQRVFFTRDSAAQVANQPPNTTLTGFFKLCEEDPFARTLKYSEVPQYYTWNSSRKLFCRRKVGQPVPGHNVFRTDALGRVYTVHPNNAECFFLRMLLHEVRGPTSFSDLRTVNGEICQTYREACLKLGLLQGDQHWDETLKEAAVISSPEQIRNLFAIIVSTCNPSNPITLWEKYKEDLSEDVLRRLQRENPTVTVNFCTEIFNEALIMIENKCVAMINKTLEQLGLEAPRRDLQEILNVDFMREKNYDVEELRLYVANKIPLLNQEQSAAYQTIMNFIRHQQGGIIFLNAHGGTGKTFLTNLILAEIRSTGEIALAVASSGIAATLMDGGRTAHSAFKLPLDMARQENPSCNISKTSGRAQLLKMCKIIIWDECTMAHRKSIEALNATLKDLRVNNRVMGGTLLLLCGDFRQILPVIPNSTPADEIHASLRHSVLWKEVTTVTLKENMRVIQDEDGELFSKTLLEIGDGTLPTQPSGNIAFPHVFCQLMPSLQHLIDIVYPDIANNFRNLDWLCDRAILAPRNDAVQKINKHILDLLPGPVREYKSVDSVSEADEAVHFPTEFLNSLDPPGLPPHVLSIKVGCPVILLRNLDPPKLCNGTRLYVTKMLPNVLEAKILTGRGKNDIVFLPKIPLSPTDLPFTFKRLQFPVRLAFSITINKSQGQSIKFCGVDLSSSCFSHGQLYVACSRAVSPRNLFIFSPQGETKNIVYKQVLL